MYDEAKQTLNVTMQLNKQNANASLCCQFGTNKHILRYKRTSSLFYTDTFFSNEMISKREFSIIQSFFSHKGFVKIYGMELWTEIVDDLKIFCKEVGSDIATLGKMRDIPNLCQFG